MTMTECMVYGQRQGRVAHGIGKYLRVLGREWGMREVSMVMCHIVMVKDVSFDDKYLLKLQG